LRDAIENFRRGYNADFDGAYDEPRNGPRYWGWNKQGDHPGWGAVYDIYQAELERRLVDADIDIGESRRRAAEALGWGGGDFENPFPVVGCGEERPLDKTVEDDSPTGRRCPTDRRVEIMFLDPQEIKEKFTVLEDEENITFPIDENKLKHVPCHEEKRYNEDCGSTKCPIWGETDGIKRFEFKYLDPIPPAIEAPEPHKSTPMLTTPDYPGSTNHVAIQNVTAYMAAFDPSGANRQSLDRFELKGGKLCKPGTEVPEPLDVGKEVYFYFSHRDDLDTSETNGFVLDISGFPLIGPITIPPGVDPVLHIDIWQQNDWCVVHNVPVDGRAATKVLMADWNEAYENGPDKWTVGHPTRYMIYTDHEKKDEQEQWNGSDPISLVEISIVDNSPVLVGTVSKLPESKCKLLMQHGGDSDKVYATTFNEIEPNGENQLFRSHHTYDRHMVNLLAAINPEPEASGPNSENEVIDTFQEPPERCLLPGDTCWQDQTDEDRPALCGTFSFSTILNYWFPYTYNPHEKDGFYIVDNNIIDTFRKGASTPKDIIEACEKLNLHGADRHCANLSKERAIKLAKLWIQAGVPVVILVNERPHSGILRDPKMCHYKTFVGFDGNRIFMNNTGMDREIDKTERDSAILDTDYEHVPIGNDVDSENAFYEKWTEYSVILALFSSADRCTLIPIYPKDPSFADSKAR
jgi:hypothetical protein